MVLVSEAEGSQGEVNITEFVNLNSVLFNQNIEHCQCNSNTTKQLGDRTDCDHGILLSVWLPNYQIRSLHGFRQLAPLVLFQSSAWFGMR